MTDDLRNRLVDVLIAETGEPPTRAALEVIETVVRETIRTDKQDLTVWGVRRGFISDYCRDAERALRLLRKNA